MNEFLFEIGLIVVLVLLNGIFAATEIALVTLRRSRIQQLIDEGNRAAVRVQRLRVHEPFGHMANGQAAQGGTRPCQPVALRAAGGTDASPGERI